MTFSPLLSLLVNIKVLSNIRKWGNMTKPDTIKLQVVHFGSCLPIFHMEI